MLSKDEIKNIALAKGFKLKKQNDGEMDLNEYVYLFADAIYLQAVKLHSKKDKPLF